MRLLEVERKARQMGIKDTWRYSKEELIKSIQKAESFEACFSIGRKKDTCSQFECCWRSDCIK